jgi:ABC-type amino acid transport substrate-binding protein
MRLAALLLAALAAGCASTGGGEPLRVASDLDNKPFAWVDEAGTPRGRDVEMMEALGARLGRPIEWVRQPFDTLLPAAQAGAVDIVCATLGVTPEREKLIDFSRPYFRTELACVTLDAPDAPRNVLELAGRYVGAGAGTTSERALLQRAPWALPVLENKAGLPALERLQSGAVEALVMDGPAADALVAASGGALVRLPQNLGHEDYALVLPPGSPLRETVDRALLALERDGTLARLDAAHGLHQVAARPGASQTGR